MRSTMNLQCTGLRKSLRLNLFHNRVECWSPVKARRRSDIRRDQECENNDLHAAHHDSACFSYMDSSTTRHLVSFQQATWPECHLLLPWASSVVGIKTQSAYGTLPEKHEPNDKRSYHGLFLSRLALAKSLLHPRGTGTLRASFTFYLRGRQASGTLKVTRAALL